MLGLLLLMSAGCERQTREFPYDRQFFIGTWDYREVFTQVSSRAPVNATNISGFVRFRSGLSTSLNFKGNFELSYYDPSDDSTYVYSGNFSWRVQSINLVVIMEGLEDDPLYPALGIGAGTLSNFLIDTRRFKENNILISDNIGQGVGDVRRSAFLERRD